jgi:sialate O-acetylesterase
MKLKFFKAAATIVVMIQALVLKADVTPNSLFSDHAVLQRSIDVPVWGTARDGEKITVEFAGQVLQTTAVQGRWMVKLKPLKAGGPFNMTIKGDNTLTLKDILVGEVWLCSGQSNMAMKMSTGIANGTQEIAEANYPQIRQYYVPSNGTHKVVEDINGSWQLCSPETIKNFTAVGYFFARDLYKKLNVPFGIILSAVGGTPAENWASRSALENNKELKRYVDSYESSLKTFPQRLEKYKQEEPQLLEKYKIDVKAAQNEKKPIPTVPRAPQNPFNSGSAGGLYEGMIKPLQPYAIRGTIWYQGEANSSRGKEYQTLFPAMIADWRNAWGQGEFPFLFVQIAPYKGMSPEIREAQLISWQKTPNTAMAVITDCGEAEDIHPKLKQPVGNRLSLAALALAYHKKIEYSGPVYQALNIKDSKAILSFTHAGKLTAKGSGLKGFTIAGSDQNFVEARAEIHGKKIIVYSAAVTRPVAVRYGWSNVPDVNLYNEMDLPATPFRTDTDNK